MYKVLPKNTTVSSKIGKNFEKIEEEAHAETRRGGGIKFFLCVLCGLCGKL
jgi:hypothetical protein